MNADSVAGEVGGQPPAATADTEAATRVLYVSYGSNLLAERLLVYLTGGAIAGNARVFPGARCADPPRRSVALELPHPLRFAREGRNWGSGGVGFLDVRPPAKADAGAHATTTTCTTLARGYDISLSQFNCVVRQENDHCVADVPRLAPAQLEALAAGGPGAGVLLVPGGSWYGWLLYLGRHPGWGLPMLTFTCPPGDAGAHPHNPPSPAYFRVILRGLLQSGVPPRRAVAYLTARAAGRLQHDVDGEGEFGGDDDDDDDAVDDGAAAARVRRYRDVVDEELAAYAAAAATAAADAAAHGGAGAMLFASEMRNGGVPWLFR